MLRADFLVHLVEAVAVVVDEGADVLLPDAFFRRLNEHLPADVTPNLPGLTADSYSFLRHELNLLRFRAEYAETVMTAQVFASGKDDWRRFVGHQLQLTQRRRRQECRQ
jgi:hypothetical protein